MLPAAGSRYLVPVVSVVQRFFPEPLDFFRSVFRLEEVEPASPFWLPKFPSGSLSELDQDALRPAVDRAVGGAVEGAAIWSIPPNQASSFVASDRFFNLIHNLWITLWVSSL